MTNNKIKISSFPKRLGAVWFRHFRVYSRSLIANALPAFLEPLIFLMGIGLGLGTYIDSINGTSYMSFLAPGLFISAAMYTSSFELTFGTFIRLEFDKVYDGMLTAPMTTTDLMVGELLWAGTKGFFMSFAVLIIVLAFGIVQPGLVFFVPCVGLLGGLMFGSLGLTVTSFVKNINHFNFFFTGFLSPLFFFSGIVFPIENLPGPLRTVAEFLPLAHVVRISRFLSMSKWDPVMLWDFGYILAFIAVFGFAGVTLVRRRLID